VCAAMKLAERALQTRGFARRGSPRSGAVGFKMTRANADLKPSKYGHAVAMRTSTAKMIPQNGLSVSAASGSEDLDNSRGLQVWSRTCYTHVK
jgi:hypothetical protein